MTPIAGRTDLWYVTAEQCEYLREVFGVDFDIFFVPVDEGARPYDHTLLEIIRTLISANYVVATGFKYGGDYLAYPGPPASCHAEYVVSYERNIPLGSRAIEMERSAHTIKKRRLIVIELSGRLRYVSLSLDDKLHFTRLGHGATHGLWGHKRSSHKLISTE